MQNLYSVRIATPAMLRQGGSAVSDRAMQVESTDLNWQLDYYCDSIQLPSKQITTGQIQNVGSGFKYATNTAYSQINMTFKVPRSHTIEISLKGGPQRWHLTANNILATILIIHVPLLWYINGNVVEVT